MDKKQIGAGVLVALVLVVAAFYFGGSGKVSEEDAQTMASDATAAAEATAAQELATSNAAHESALVNVQANADAAATAAAAERAALGDQLAAVQGELAAMQETAAEEAVAEEEAEAEELETCSYVLDNLMIDFELDDEVLSDRELECTLFDGEVEWDGSDYEAEETLSLEGLYVGSNYEDFGTDVCLELEEGEVFYRFEVEEGLDTEEIGGEDFEGEFLEFSLLGEDVKLSEWTCDEITFFKGSKHRVNEGDSLTVEYDGESYTLYFAVITEDSVFIEVGDDSDEVDEGDSRVIGGLDILVDSVLENEAGEVTPDMAIIYVGSDVQVSVEDGDEYAEDSPWEWDIDCSYIGLRLVEDFDDPDDDDFPALCAGDELCLPNDFLCLRFDGMVDEDYAEYNLDLDSGMSRVEGEFEFGLDDYDEVWCDGNATFWSDNNMDPEDELGSTLELPGTDLELECVNDGPFDRVCFIDNENGDDVCVRNNFGGANADGDFITDEDEDFISDFGMIVEVPEDCLEDEDCTVRVPDERLEGSLTVYAP